MSRSLRFVLGALLLGAMFASSNTASAQKVLDYKVKNSTNQADRTAMLNLLRAAMKKEFEIEFQYVVNKFNVSNGWAWLACDAQRKDGKKLEIDESYDCCHVEALFQKVNGKWTIYDHGAFSTDVWWEGIGERSGAPAAIFE